MKFRAFFRTTVVVLGLLAAASIATAQGTRADYERANALRDRYQALAVNVAESANWIGETSRFWYRKSVKGGNEFVLVDAAAPAKKPAFDHERLAASLAAASGEKVTAVTLPFPRFQYVDGEKAIEFVAYEAAWKCSLADYACTKTGPAPRFPFGMRSPDVDFLDSPAEPDDDVRDGMTVLYPQTRPVRAGAPGGIPGRARSGRDAESFSRRKIGSLHPKL